MSYSVRPDEMAVAAGLTEQDVGGLAEALRLVVAAGRQADDGVAPGGQALVGAVAGYVHVEATAAQALGDASRILATGLAEAGSRYASAEAGVLAGFARGGLS